MKKPVLLLLCLGVILAITAVILLTQTTTKNTEVVEVDSAIARATQIYKEAKAKGVDFSKGPCLSNSGIPGWVVDISHNPRLRIDNLPENQCPNYRKGNALHFIELDPEGNLIKWN